MQTGRRYRIAIVNHQIRMGGAEVALLRLAEALRDRHELHSILPAEGPLADGLRRLGVPVTIVVAPSGSLDAQRDNSWRLFSACGRDLFAWPGAVRALSAAVGSSDLVLTGSTKAHLYGGLAARMAGRPLIWWLHDTVDSTTFGFLARTLMRVSAKRLPHRVFAVSKAAASSLGFSPDDPRVRVIYNSVPVRSGASEAGRCSTRRVGWVGRLIPSKGPDVFLRVAERVSARVPSAQFSLVGAEDPREAGFAARLRSEAKNEHGNVELLGYQENLPAFFDGLDVLAFTSIVSDSLPNVILEAMASGVPVVAFAGGGVGEIIDEGRTGYTVPIGRTDLMAERVMSLLESPDERRAIADQARAKVDEVFGWNTWVERWTRELDDVMGGGVQG